MDQKPTYEELEQRVKELEKGEAERQEVQEQLALFHQFVEASREGMGWADLDGRVRYINSTLCSMFGETNPEDSYGRPVLQYYSEETQRRLQEEIFPNVLREGAWTGELVIHSLAGSLIPTTNSLIVLRDAEGNPSSFANVLTDLTERKKAEEELRRHRDHLEELVAERTNALEQNNQKLQREITERKQVEDALRGSEEKYKQLTEQLSDVVLTLKLGGRLSYLSPAIKGFGGYNPEEEVGNHIGKYFANKKELIKALKLIKQIYIDKKPSSIEFLFKPVDRDPFYVEVTGRPLIIENKVKSVQCVMRNITNRKQAEEALRESESKFRSLFDLSPQAIALTTMETGDLIDVNNKFCELTKYAKEEILGRTTTEVGFYSEKDRNKFIRNFQEYGEVNGLEMEFIAKDGSILTTLMFARTIQISGDTFILTIFNDVTGQKQLEVQLQHAQRMEAIGKLAGGIAHDFNNILSAIIGYSELAVQDVPKGSDLQFNLLNVLKAGDRAKDLVSQILAFSRQSKIDPKPVRLKLIAKEVLKLLRASLPTTIEIRQNIESNSAVMADPTQIHQVIMNLCTNAGYAMRETGGILFIELLDTDLDADFATRHPGLQPGRFIKLMISDTGHGMPHEIINQIFDPFFTTKITGEGTGMGLSVVHGIIKSFGGTITVDSEVNKGSTFNVYIPVIEADAVPEVDSVEALLVGNESILFIDDEDIQVNLGKQVLERLGYKVVTRTSSIEALELFRIKPNDFDLVITDMTMPNMTGDALAQKLMLIRPDIPIILCTGYSELISEEKASKIGVRAFVMKPIVMKDIAETIRKVLDEV